MEKNQLKKTIAILISALFLVTVTAGAAVAGIPHPVPIPMPVVNSFQYSTTMIHQFINYVAVTPIQLP